jgi:hypothetical protein
VPPNITPAVITNVENSAFYGAIAQMSGWGVSNNGEPVLVMQKVNVTVLTLRDCYRRIQELTGELLTLDPSIICTAANPYALSNQVRYDTLLLI